MVQGCIRGGSDRTLRKRFFIERVTGGWNRLAREVIMAPSLSEFKECLGDALSHIV